MRTLARNNKETEWESSYVDKIEFLNELYKERAAFLSTFRLPGYEDEPEEEKSSSEGAGLLSGNSNEERVWNFLAQKGLTPQAIAGTLANLKQESGVDPKKQQLGGGPGRGLCQWEVGGRWNSLVKWAKEKGKDEWAIETQLEWMWKELSTSDIDRRMKNAGSPNGFAGWQKLTDYKEACRIFEEAFERAGKPNMPRRYTFAQEYYDKWGKNGPSTVAASGDARKVIEVAQSWLKKSNKYVFGGGRTTSDIKAGRFDCSSFVRYCFEQAGYNIGSIAGTTTNTLIKKGKSVKTDNLKAGDLVFFDTYKTYGHVTIYLGSGKCIGTQGSTGVAVIDMVNNSYWKARVSSQHRRII